MRAYGRFYVSSDGQGRSSARQPPQAISLAELSETGQMGHLGACESGSVGERENDRVDT